MSDEHPVDPNDFVVRIGTFLIILGIFAFIFFLASDFSNQTDFDWLFAGVVLFLIGFVFRRKAPPPPPSGRFSGIRKWRENAKKRKQERAEKKKAKNK